MSKVMPNQPSTGGYGYGRPQERQERYIDDLLESWKFFPPSKPLVRDMLQLQECLSDGYLDDEYRRTRESASENISAEHDEDVKVLESQIKKKYGFELLFSKAASVFGVAQREKQRESSADDQIRQHQSFVSERIYNHLAMLGRTPGTMAGEAFSIREELTMRLAEKVGLGLYLSPRIDNELRQEGEGVMLRLAGEYQDWLLDKTQDGPLPTTWGYICVFERPIPEEVRATHPLILIADVAKTEFAR